jgi:hypothetical protein
MLPPVVGGLAFGYVSALYPMQASDMIIPIKKP